MSATKKIQQPITESCTGLNMPPITSSRKNEDGYRCWQPDIITIRLVTIGAVYAVCSEMVVTEETSSNYAKHDDCAFTRPSFEAIFPAFDSSQ